MQHQSRAWMVAVFSAIGFSCTGPVDAQETTSSISGVSENVAEVIKSGVLSRLRELIADESITFEKSGAINEEIACFLNWSERCSFAKVPIQDILKEGYFKYYYHIDESNIVVSYINKSSRTEFDADPAAFLESRYLDDYFSCHFALVGGRWMLTESVCFSETEGPFSPEPEV